MHYYKRNLGDYSKKAGRLSMLQHGAYTLLMDACYDREQFPTMEEAIDWTWASSKEEIEAVEFVLKKFFSLEGGVYIQARIKQEIEEYQAKADTNKRIAREREEKRRAEAEAAKRENKSTNRERSVNEAMENSNEPPPNHKPLTTNQEPSSKDLASSADDTETDSAGRDQHRPKRFTARNAPLPDSVDRDNWIRWCEFRSSKRKPISEQAAQQQIGMLAEHPPDAQRAIVQQSIQNDYQGLFPPKGDRHASNHQPDKPRSAVDRVNAGIEQRSREREEALARQRQVGDDARPAVGADDRDIRAQMDERLRGLSGGRVGDCIDGDYARDDPTWAGSHGY